MSAVTTTQMSARWIALRYRARMARYHVRNAFRRYSRARRYALGTWSHDDADEIRRDAQMRSSVYPLTSICGADVMQDLQTLYRTLPTGAEAFADAAAARVASRWSDGGEALSGALGWAVEVAEHYAAAAGTPFSDPREPGDDGEDDEAAY